MPPILNTFEVLAHSSHLAPFRKKLRSLLEEAGFDEKKTHDVLLSVDEVLTNVIRHAYGSQNENQGPDKIRVSFSNSEDRAEIVIEDQGPSFDPSRFPSPSLPPEKPGGLGIHLVRSLIDELHYESLKPKGNRLRLVKYKNKKERKNQP